MGTIMKHGMLGLLATLGLGLSIIAGCAEPEGRKVETVDVSGTVTLDGKPLASVAVVFFSGTNHAGTGITGPDGSYKLGNGAEPGENKVYFSSANSVSEQEDDEGPDDDMEADMAAVGDEEEQSNGDEAIPEKYRNAETTELTFSVPAGGTDAANFELTSD